MKRKSVHTRVRKGEPQLTNDARELMAFAFWINRIGEVFALISRQQSKDTLYIPDRISSCGSGPLYLAGGPALDPHVWSSRTCPLVVFSLISTNCYRIWLAFRVVRTWRASPHSQGPHTPVRRTTILLRYPHQILQASLRLRFVLAVNIAQKCAQVTIQAQSCDQTTHVSGIDDPR